VSNKSPTRIVVGLSGGVDSSVAALLLKEQGHAVRGLFMKNWEEDDTEGECAAAEDLQDARSVCARLDIPLHTVNFSAEYWERVFTYFLEEIRAGRTPNPDVMCNKEIKFSAFLEHALSLGAEHIATGHYARIEEADGSYRLMKARDLNKDQTYFLYTLGQPQLARVYFPLAELTKPEVRRKAAQAGLITQGKKDSTGICFIGERNFRDFLSRYISATPGNICTPEGEVLGRHGGLMFYTLGQRQGLGIGGRHGKAGEPWYVAAKDMGRNVLIVVQGHDHPLLFARSLTAIDIHWVSGQPPALPLHCHAKTRYRQADQPCTLTTNAQGQSNVDFDAPQWAVTPGQSVVFYRGDECLGGGIIDCTS